MTPDEQVKEIIKMLSPEDASTQTDAVFIVQKVFQKLRAELAAKDKQLALAEAKLEAKGKEVEDTINEKLESETRLKKEKEDLLKPREATQKDVVQKPAKEKTF